MSPHPARPVHELNRLGLFGGTFNPVHNGHLVTARKAAAARNLSKIIFIPAYIPPHKQGEPLISPHHRTSMLDRALEGENKMLWSDAELSRRGTSYTIDTIRYFRQEYPDAELFFLTGSDSLDILHTWKNIEILIEQCVLTIIARPGFPCVIPENLKKKLPPEAVESLRNNRLDIETPDISSTRIREMVQSGMDISGLVPHPVRQYIERNNLYIS